MQLCVQGKIIPLLWYSLLFLVCEPQHLRAEFRSPTRSIRLVQMTIDSSVINKVYSQNLISLIFVGLDE